MTAAAIRRAAGRDGWLADSWGSIVLATACAAAFGYLMFSPDVFNDGDTYWHIAAGRWMLAHGEVLHRDVFSYTHAGQPWMTHEWLSEILMALAYNAASWNGVLVLYSLSAAATAGLISYEVGRKLGGISLPILVGLALTIMMPSVLARPHLLSLTLLVGWTVVLMRAREAGRAPPLVAALIMAVWANLHGSFIYGFVLAGAFGLEALFDPALDRWKTIRTWGLFGAATLAASCLTPHGIWGLVYPVRIMSMQTLYNIGEWKPLSFAVVQPLEYGLLLALFFGLVRGVRIGLFRVLLLLLLLHLSLIHQRYQIVLAATAPLIFAEPLAVALGQGRRPAPRLWPSLAIFAAGALVMTGFRFAHPAARHDDFVTPQTAMSHVPRELLNQPLLNTYDFGGYLIFHGLRPYIDGRADMYGDDAMRLHAQLMHADMAVVDKTVARYGITWMLLSPREPLAKAMEAKPGWTKLYGDFWGVVFVKAPAPAA